jgi:hypothetical protein
VRSLVVDMVGMVGVWVWGGVCLVGVVGLEGVECVCVCVCSVRGVIVDSGGGGLLG